MRTNVCSTLPSNLKTLNLLDLVHASKDNILLEGDDGAGYSDDGDEDEVFALRGMRDDSDDDEEEYEHDEQDLDAEAVQDSVPASNKKEKKGKKSKKALEKGKMSSDDEEKSEEEEESWGKGRAAYYSSNADQLESDDEEGNELEEQEAKRLQAKTREEMNDEDFGLNDDLDIEGNDESR